MGWREVDGQDVYLHAGGAIGPNGPVSGVEVRLDDPLAGFVLPAPPVGTDLNRSVRASLGLLDLAPDRILFPLLAATYRAPLGASDTSVHYTGPTGAFKTEIAALDQRHYGAGLDSRHLPGSWSSTANANEDLLFRAKDALIVIDDFAPGGSQHEIGRANREADRVMRAQANGSARQRMRADGSLRPPRPPRGLTLSTGEDVPKGASLVARMVVIEVGPNDVDVDRLTRCQADAAAGLYASAMSAYICWLAQRGALGRKALLDMADADVDSLAGGGEQHRRTSPNLKSLACGLNAFLTSSVDAQVIDAVERERLWSRGLAAFREISKTQAVNQASENPVKRFIDLLRSAVASGKAHVAGPDGNRPEHAEAWGWRRDDARSDQYAEGWRPQGSRIGWVDGGHLYLDPNASHAAAQDVGRGVGDTISLQPKTLHKRLNEAGFLLSTEHGRGHLTVRRTLGGSRPDVLHLASALLQESAQPTQPARHAGVLDPRGPVVWADSGDEENTNGPDAGPEAARIGSDVSPNGTDGPTWPIRSSEDDIVSVMQRLVDTGALIGHPPVQLGPGTLIVDVEQSVGADLLSAGNPGHVGDVARDRLAAMNTMLASTPEIETVTDADSLAGIDVANTSIHHGTPLTPPRLCPSCRLMHPVGVTCAWSNDGDHPEPGGAAVTDTTVSGEGAE